MGRVGGGLGVVLHSSQAHPGHLAFLLQARGGDGLADIVLDSPDRRALLLMVMVLVVPTPYRMLA